MEKGSQRSVEREQIVIELGSKTIGEIEALTITRDILLKRIDDNNINGCRKIIYNTTNTINSMITARESALEKYDREKQEKRDSLCVVS